MLSIFTAKKDLYHVLHEEGSYISYGLNKVFNC